MSGAKDMKMQITPETPGRLVLRNPFESPSDYSHLQEPTLSSPSLFQSTQSFLSPGTFAWSIEDLALINPVEIDSEDIRRQALYLNHARIDKEAEEKRQKAIEEFFTKSLIVPSPWTDHGGKQDSPFNSTRCVELISASPASREVAGHLGKTNAACQTVLSLPVDFDLEKILGAYFKPDESADQSQESLSSSSLRRKLFLDENGSLSENLSPSPQSSHSIPASLGLCSTDISPVHCRSLLNTRSSGQFSSSPVQGGRTHSLGSLATPPFLERSPANIVSPTVSPIGIQIRKTPLSGRFTFRSPDIPCMPNSRHPTPPPTRSSFVECSPLKNCSPMRLVACRGAAVYQTSFVHLPSTPESFDEEQEKEMKGSSPETSLAKVSLHPLNGDGFAHGQRPVAARSPDCPGTHVHGPTFPRSLDSLNENCTVDMVDMEEVLDVNSVKGLVESGALPAVGFSVEGPCTCLSPLAESSSLQADSGYNTQHRTSSLMDTVGEEAGGREDESHVYETQSTYSVFKTRANLSRDTGLNLSP